MESLHRHSTDETSSIVIQDLHGKKFSGGIPAQRKAILLSPGFRIRVESSDWDGSSYLFGVHSPSWFDGKINEISPFQTRPIQKIL